MAQTKNTRPKLDNQSGSSISKIAALYNKYLVDPAKLKGLKPKDFAEMRSKDGTFMALTNLLTLPILASDWDIEPDEINDPDGTQAEFVKDALTKSPEQGGMTTPFHLVIADMLRSTYEAWRGFEKVYTLSPYGKIVFKKIVSYPSETLHIDMTDKGDFDGFTQTIDGEPVKIDKSKCVLITQGKERNWLTGESLLLAAANHYYEKQKFYYLGGLQAQAYAIPSRVAIAAEGSKPAEREDAAQDLQDAADLNSAVVLPYGYEIQDPSGSAKSDMIEFINHHDRQMALSILAQFLSLGSTSTGSFALSKDQTDLFNFVIKSIEKNLEYHINAFVLSDLTKFNFAKPSFPRLKFADLTDAMMEVLENTFNTIVSKRPEIITEEFAKSIVDKMALQLGIDIEEINQKTDEPAENPEEVPTVDEATDDEITALAEQTTADVAEVAKQALNGAQTTSLLSIVKDVIAGAIPEGTARATIVAAFPFLTQAEINSIMDPINNFTAKTTELSKKKLGCNHDHRKSEFAEGEKVWRRELTQAEKRVNFANINAKMDTFEEELLTNSTEIIEKMTAEGSKYITEQLEDGNRRKALQYQVSDELKTEYHDILVKSMLKSYNYGKTSASGELKQQNIATPKETKNFLEEQATSIVEKQASDIEYQFRQAIMAGDKVELALGIIPTSIKEILDLAKTLIAKWFGISVPSGVSATTANIVNKGRDDIFWFYRKKVKRMQYSAILDSRVCGTCKDLDETVVTYDQYRRSVWQPPIHFYCRCIWIAIMEEDELPETTGFQSSYGGLEAPTLVV